MAKSKPGPLPNPPNIIERLRGKRTSDIQLPSMLRTPDARARDLQYALEPFRKLGTALNAAQKKTKK